MDEAKKILLKEIQSCIEWIHEELIELSSSNVKLHKKRKRVSFLTQTSRILVHHYIDILKR